MQYQNYGDNLNSFGAIIMVSLFIMVCFETPIAYEVNVLPSFTVIQLVILDLILVTSITKSDPV